MLQRVEILPVPDLSDRSFGAGISFQFNDHGRIFLIYRDKDHVCKTFSSCHFPDHSVAVQSIDIGKTDGAHVAPQRCTILHIGKAVAV